MKTTAFKLRVAVLAGGTLLATTLPAEARHDRHDHREWRHDYRGHGHAYGPKHKHKQKTVVVHRAPKRTVVHQYHYYPQPYYAPPPVQYYSRQPAVVIGVNIPPIVIPIR